MASQWGKHIRNQVPKKILTVAISCGLATIVTFYIVSYCSSLHTNLLTYTHNSDINNRVTRIIKRASENIQMLDYYSSCIVEGPSGGDIHKLCAHRDCSTLHCSQSESPGDNNKTQVSITTCFTKACARFKVINSNKNTAHTDVNLSRLSAMVNAHSSKTDTFNNMEVICSDYNSHLFGKKLELDITNEKSTKPNLEEVSNSESGSKSNREIKHINIPGSNIYLIYFRFMSKWESFLNLPRLNGLLENKRNDKSWDLHSFGRMQSQSFVLEDNLQSVLGFPGESSFKTPKENLIQLAADSGLCVLLNVLACHKAEVYSEIEQAVMTENNARNCNKDKYGQHDIRATTSNNSQSLCDSSNAEIDLDADLYIHEQIEGIYASTSSNIFTISIINVPDMPSSNVLDTSITELVAKIVSRQSNILILMSDVGDPKFSRFDESVFLRTQTFNPLLHLLIPRTISGKSPGITLLISDLRMKETKSLVTDLSDVHGLAKTLILSVEDKDNGTREIENMQMKNESEVRDRDGPRSVGVCPGRRLKGPVECLCQGNHVRFPNDSIQAAFASFVVGSLNNKLLDLASPLDSLVGKMNSWDTHSADVVRQLVEDRFKCDRLIGVSFKSVYHVLWKKSTYILMTLHVRPSSRRSTRAMRIEADVEYTTDDSYNTIFSVHLLHPTKFPLPSLSRADNKTAKRILHLLCQPPNELNVDITSHQEYLHFISSESHFGMKATTKTLHHPCLFLASRNFGDSTALDAVNVCDDRVYNLTVGAELVNVMSMASLPVEVTLGPLETRYVSTLVKNAYVVTRSVYKINTYYKVTLI